MAHKHEWEKSNFEITSNDCGLMNVIANFVRG